VLSWCLALFGVALMFHAGPGIDTIHGGGMALSLMSCLCSCGQLLDYWLSHYSEGSNHDLGAHDGILARDW
jgi:hypothetical protein